MDKIRQPQKFEKGDKIEKYILSLLPKESIQTSQAEHYDIKTGETLIEVKSAEVRTSNGFKRGTKWGRFIINNGTHEKLIEEKAWYALVLTFKLEPIVTSFIKAKDVRVMGKKGFRYIPITMLYEGIPIGKFQKEVQANLH